MQTFLCEDTFVKSAEALDYQRLGKQRVETLQLLKALNGEYKKGWVNHPACKMWRGYEQQLIDYGLLICIEWIARGYKDTCYDKILLYESHFPYGHKALPWYTEDFIRAHRSNLIRKDPEYYGPKWPGVPPDLPYIWPE